MNINKWFALLLLLVLTIAQARHAVADGYRNPPPTAEGIGKSGANMVFVDDASSVFYNPANLTNLDGTSIAIGLTFGHVQNEYTSAYTGLKARSNTDWIVLPDLFIASPIGDRGLVVGLGITTPYGQGGSNKKYDLVNIPAFTNMAPPAIHEGKIALMNINPTVALKLNEKLSIGVGIDLYYSALNFKQFYPWSSVGFPADQDIEAEGDGFGLGGNAAITWAFADNQSMVLTYRSEFEIEYEGDLTASPVGVAVPPQLASSSFGLDITYPTVVGVAYGIELGEKVRLEADVEWVGWSANKSQTANLGSNGSLTIPQNWDDVFTYSIGGDWQFDEHWVMRAGYSFLESPVPAATVAPILPDPDRHAISLGLGYTTGGHTFDVAYTFSIYSDRNVSTAENSLFPGAYDVDSDLIGLTYSYSY